MKLVKYLSRKILRSAKILKIETRLIMTQIDEQKMKISRSAKILRISRLN